jgi:hypothetical protein
MIKSQSKNLIGLNSKTTFIQKYMTRLGLEPRVSPLGGERLTIRPPSQGFEEEIRAVWIIS